MVSQRPDAKDLGGVVAGGDEVNPQLARLRHHALGGLARDERLRACGGRPLDVVGARARGGGPSPPTPGPRGANERPPPPPPRRAGGGGGRPKAPPRAP